MDPMERELLETFEAAKKAADATAEEGGASSSSSPEADRCMDALNRLRKIKVTTGVLVSTQVGKPKPKPEPRPQKPHQAQPQMRDVRPERRDVRPENKPLVLQEERKPPPLLDRKLPAAGAARQDHLLPAPDAQCK